MIRVHGVTAWFALCPVFRDGKGVYSGLSREILHSAALRSE